MEDVKGLLAIVLASISILGLAYTLGIKFAKLEGQHVAELAELKMQMKLVFDIVIVDALKERRQAGAVSRASPDIINPKFWENTRRFARESGPEARRMLEALARDGVSRTDGELAIAITRVLGLKLITARSDRLNIDVKALLAMQVAFVRGLQAGQTYPMEEEAVE